MDSSGNIPAAEGSTGIQRNAAEESMTSSASSPTIQATPPTPMEIDAPSPPQTQPPPPQTSHEQTEQLQASVEDTPEPSVPTSEHQRMGVDEPLLEEASAVSHGTGLRLRSDAGASGLEAEGQTGRSSVEAVSGSTEHGTSAADVGISSIPEANASSTSAHQPPETRFPPSISAALAPAFSSAPPLTTTTETIPHPLTTNVSECASVSNPEAQNALKSNENRDEKEDEEKDLPSLPIENVRQPYSSSRAATGSSSTLSGRSARLSGASLSGSRAGEGQGQGQGLGGGGGGVGGAAARGMPMSYTKAYGLDTRGAIEKEDYVQTVVNARSAVTGCLSPEAESYYRRRSVPKQGVLPTPPQTQSPRPQARPQPSQGQTQGRPSEPTQGQTGGFRPQAYRPASSSSTPRGHPGAGYRPSPRATTPQAVRTPPSRSNAPTPASTPRRAPSPPVPSILSLVALPQSYLPSLSIGTLKAILYENHVKVDFSQVLEKQELVGRVAMLVADERRRLERQRAAEEAEEREVSGLGGTTSVDVPAAAAAPTAEMTGLQVNENDGTRSASPSATPTTIPEVPTGPKASVERDGLCVVCQDQEAVFANIDCGHLCMIVTEQRLIRIFKT
ncbi:hypothetical protein QFC21_005644 [Naganishia friedmannii]|uniref:Uncharacterized protein n=1 Tax=Naganishia friedmannii TaxID=89922 RepID=A0ACC2V821_9TREE|nr:hypothetical protein QFC21_005644 [Naganishia friedmannii]